MSESLKSNVLSEEKHTFDELKESLYRNFTDGWMKSVDCKEGWSNIIYHCHKNLLFIDKDYKIFQVKEKFGTLRFYCEPSRPELKSQFSYLISRLEEKSSRICEVTGDKGVLMQKDGHYQTLNSIIGEQKGYAVRSVVTE